MCLISLRAGSVSVTFTGTPPEAGTRSRVRSPVVKRSTPTQLHEPAVARPPAHSVTGGPPAISIRFNFRSAKNANDLLSGDQNGESPSSVPASERATGESSGRSHRVAAGALLGCERKMIQRPSGDTAVAESGFWNPLSGGGAISNSIARVGAAG